MAGSKRGQLNRRQIEASLKSAVWNLAPDVLEQIDLGAPQEKPAAGSKSLLVLRRRVIGTLAAACLCMVVLAGGSYTYQNGRVDSVIGIDVNPSVELSVNKRNKVLEAKALNEDAGRILEEMDLKGVDLNVAVNAVIGAMVTHGFLDDLDNAILVTVSNDSISKATDLRTQVVGDIQDALEEKQVKAVVYDQQVIEEEEVKKLTEEYGISYGKAYFLKELIDQNPSLTMEDMEELARLTMEEIAREITERSYAVSGRTGVNEEMKEETQTTESQPATADQTMEESVFETETSQETAAPEPESSSQQETQPVIQTQPQIQPQTQPLPSEPETTSEETQAPVDTSGGNIKIDYVDYENGVVTVHFKNKVKWKNPTVSVKDEDGNTYSAKVEDTDTYECEVHVSGLRGGAEYTFVLGGVSLKIGKQTTVRGVFETPVIGEGSPDSTEDEEMETEETKESQSAETSSEEESQTGEESKENESLESAGPSQAPETTVPDSQPETLPESIAEESEESTQSAVSREASQESQEEPSLEESSS